MTQIQKEIETSRVIKIDPFNKTITEETLSRESIKPLQDMVGGYFEVVHLDSMGCILWVDEEGLFKPDTRYFQVTNVSYMSPLAGIGVLTSNHVPSFRDCPLTLEEVKAFIQFEK